MPGTPCMSIPHSFALSSNGLWYVRTAIDLSFTGRRPQMAEKIPEREGEVLEYIIREGYVQPSSINTEILDSFSIHTVRRVLKSLLDQQLIEYKELPSESGKGAGERVYHITKEGLIASGKSGAEITAYIKRLQSVHSLHLRHFLEVKKVEKFLLKSLHECGFLCESCNEFNDEHKILHIKMSEKGKFINVRSDAQLKIQGEDKAPRLTLRMERDLETENLTDIGKKLRSYSLFFQSNLATKHSETFPIYILFVAPESRIFSILKNIRNYGEKEYCLFLPIEKLDQGNLFTMPFVQSGNGTLFPLVSIINRRTPILNFCNAMQQLNQRQTTYEIITSSIYTTAFDPFFPMLLKVKNNDLLWKPDGYVRIRKRCQPDGNTIEALFALVASVCDLSGENLINKIRYYDMFLRQETCRKRVTSLPKYFGCFIIVENEKQCQEVCCILQNFTVRQITRIILKASCTPEKIQEPVWVSVTGSTVSLFPAGISS